MAALPPGVTLVQIDGGANYYSSHGFTYAANAGWDSPNFFPVGVWEEALTTQSDATRWHDVGWNTAFNITANSNLSIARSNGIWVIQNADDGIISGTGVETVGLLSADENYANSVTSINTTPNSIQDHRPWWINSTWTALAFGDIGGVPMSQILSQPLNTPDGTTRHLDTQSVDLYWFTAGHEEAQGIGSIGYEGGLIYNLGHDMTADEAARGSNYGDMIDIERAYQGANPAPITAFIEDGEPGNAGTDADYIQPAEMNWAVWSSIIHGARDIVYFNHTFSGSNQSNDNLAQPFYQTIQPGQTISIYDQVKATDALIEQLAPVLNSPFALNYVTVAGPHYSYGQGFDSTLGGLEVMAKDDNGQFYIFADTRDSETQHNIPAVFTLNDPNAVSVTVVNENRTIPVVNGSFSDTFANASTVHIYQVNDSATPPPPGPPAAPVITSFSPDTAPTGDGHTTATSITLTGKGLANSTVNVFDGQTSVGHASVDASGAWSLLDSGLTVGAHTFTATDTNANGTSAASAAYVVTIDASTAPPPGGNLVTNGGFETGNFTGWTESGNVAPLSYGPQLFITSSAHSGQDAAGFGSVGSDGTISQNLTTVVGQSYTLDFWLANAAGGTDDFTAKIGGVTELHLVNAAAQPYTHYTYTFTATSTSTPLEFDFRQDPSEWHLDDVSVVQVTAPPAPPAAPVIASFSPDTAPVGDGHTTATSITLTGKGLANSTVNVFDGQTSVGHASVDASGAWSLLDSGLTVGAHTFTATDTNANGTSAASAAYVVTIDAPTAPPPGGNLVTNGGFETGDFTGWTPSGNVAQLSIGPQLFITNSAHSGQDAAGFGSVGSDGTISQNLTTVVGQSYTLDFWLANTAGGTDDFTAKIGGVTELHLVNAAAQPYTHYTYTFTATSTSTPLEFDFRQDPSEWHLDDVSVVQVTGISPLAALHPI